MFFEIARMENERAIGLNLVVDNKAVYLDIYLVWFGIMIGVGTPPDEQ